MKFISTFFKKFNKSSSKTQKSTASSSENNIWSHNSDEKLKKTGQKKMEEEKEIRQRTLRRQNRFLGFQNDFLALQNERLIVEKKKLREKCPRRRSSDVSKSRRESLNTSEDRSPKCRNKCQ
uniref:Uncharacterized protein n=1 Tax=Caenorhabditis tropicalis TaxID=1561998 RepID=A0A1I7TIS5_9PELO